MFAEFALPSLFSSMTHIILLYIIVFGNLKFFKAGKFLRKDWEYMMDNRDGTAPENIHQSSGQRQKERDLSEVYLADLR